MKPEFTESTFAFAYSQELVKRLNLLTIPEFISQQSEALKGYDVKFNCKEPIFIQFKISSYLYGPKASEMKLAKSPYFRFNLHRDNKRKIVYNQHSLLCKLNKTNKHVYYCAPIFYKKKDLDLYFRNSKLLENSVLIKPNQMGNVWKKVNHKVIYNKSLSFCYFLSKPKQIKCSILEGLELRENINLNRKYWLDIMKEVKKRLVLQIEEKRESKIKRIEFKETDVINEYPIINEYMSDSVYELEEKRNKIQDFTKDIKKYDYTQMVSEIKKFLENELNIHILL